MNRIHRILVPTDFSPISRNALNYAIGFAKASGASITVLHTYELPLPPVSLDGSLMADYSRINLAIEEDQLQKLITEIASIDSAIETDYIINYGFVADEIISTSHKQSFDLIIMGTHGAKGMATILGSVAANVLQQSDCPVLIIPSTAVFKEPLAICFLSDLNAVNTTEVYNALIHMTQLFNAEVRVLYVDSESSPQKMYEKDAFKTGQLEEVLSKHNVRYSFHHSAGNSLEKGLEEINKAFDLGMTAIMPRKHSFFSKLFSKSESNQIAYSTQMPLLGFKS